MTTGRWTLLAWFALSLPFPSGVRCDEQFKFGDYTITVPEGFEVERVAGPPLVDHPVCADFDRLGRLFVADQSSGSSERANEQAKKGLNSVVRLEDTDGDGRYDRRTVFASGLGFGEGVLCHGGSVYVAAPPSIWRLTDEDGDGVAERREEWFTKTASGCGNDLHGPFLGLDGWIYWAKGGFKEHTYERAGRAPIVSRASHIFRAREDYGEIEPVMTGGMDNPVEVVFTESGERIFTTTFVQHPAIGRRDGLVHAIYGGVYGKRNRIVDWQPRTGELMPVLVHTGPSADCGLARYESAVLGADYQDNLFSCSFNLRKVFRHELEPHGATFQARTSDFLTCDAVDFHPTDVVEDADGSLVVLDTGGWYKICCPTSQIQKSDVLGAIYRVRRRGAAVPDDPRGLSMAWPSLGVGELAALLADTRPAVRKRAIAELAARGARSLSALSDVLQNSVSSAARRGAVWTLTRIDDIAARAIARQGLNDADESVRQSAAHSAAVWRDREARPRLEVALRSGPSLGRPAAEALGRLGDSASVPALLEATAGASGRVFEHSLIYALIEIGAAEKTRVGLGSPNPRTKRAAAIALDQMEGGTLDPKVAVAWLDGSDPLLRETATWLVDQHADWGSALGPYFRRRLRSSELNPAQLEHLRPLLARCASEATVQELLGELVRDSAVPVSSRRVALRAMAEADLKVAPDSWSQPVAAALAAKGDGETVRQAVGTAVALRFSEDRQHTSLAQALMSLAEDESSAAGLRVEALSAVPGRLPEISPRLFELLRSRLQPGELVQTRASAAGVLVTAKLSRSQLIELADTMGTVGPLEVPALLPAFGDAMDEVVGARLLTALERSKGRSGLRGDQLQKLVVALPQDLKPRGERFVATLAREVEEQKLRFKSILDALPEGDVRRGQAVFRSEKTACYTCHSIGYLGGNLGPDLTGVGRVRTKVDLLESLLFPSSSLVRSYEPVLVVTRSGATHNGLVRNETSDEIVLATGANTEVRVSRDDVALTKPSTVSVMPAGLDKQLSEQELADLLTFLKAPK